MALGPTVIRSLTAVAGSEIRIPDRWGGRDGKRTDRQNGGEELASAHVLLLWDPSHFESGWTSLSAL
jgi:hypothetical protein